ncbi:cell envelope integrity protein TolA [Providencia rettgeri]|uniref:phage tail fiber protein n=1 Tax=Providencia rettgeri TaxID=587 RepID=UPI001C2233B0|nr:cell envelope integrity protein TolA [Providencia rettgeri]QXB92516.1 cell envelope integrity protein TolA [Providencia rettgeri]
MYNIGTVTTTANSPKITGTGTRWKDNTTLISVGQVVLIENGSNLLINSIYSIESNTALTLAFPVSAKLTNAKYIILTTMIDSISDGVNKATAQVIASEVYTEILNQWMTAQGTIDVELPTGQKIKLRTVAEMDKQLDGKLNKAGGTITRNGAALTLKNIADGNNHYLQFQNADGKRRAFVGFGSDTNKNFSIVNDDVGVNLTIREGGATISGAEVLKVGDYGLGFSKTSTDLSAKENGFFNSQQFSSVTPTDAYFGFCAYNTSKSHGFLLGARRKDIIAKTYENNVVSEHSLYHTGNTTKDSNGNLKAASPIVKLFSDDIELNDESEGVEMEHLGVGHYLIKGVVGFNADGAWGINNGFVIPQDHNGKNMVLIDYEVRPDGDIEVFVFHQQNADMPERFQNKRIKHFDEEGTPVYFENYEPCDVPESRWIDMRVEMPPNSLYNQKQAEAERLAKLEAERLAQEEAKRAAEEVERAEQDAAERK